MTIGEFLSPQKALRAVRVQEGMSVADFGAGAGFFARAAARAAGPSGVVWAVDAHREGLARVRSLGAAEQLFNIEISAGNIEERGGSQLPEESIDLVIAANVLFSAHDKRAVVEEIWRVLKPRGKVLVIDWQGSFGGLGPQPEHLVTKEQALMLFEKGGFERLPAATPAAQAGITSQDSVVQTGAYHWGLMLRKRQA